MNNKINREEDLVLFIMNRKLNYDQFKGDINYFAYRCRCSFKGHSGVADFFYLNKGGTLVNIIWEGDYKPTKEEEEKVVSDLKNTERYKKLFEENGQFFQTLFKWFEGKCEPEYKDWEKEKDGYSFIMIIEHVEYEVLLTIGKGKIERVQIGIETDTFNNYFQFYDVLKSNMNIVLNKWSDEIRNKENYYAQIAIQNINNLTLDFRVLYCESASDLDEYLKFKLNFNPAFLSYPETYVLYWHKKNQSDLKYTVGCKTMRGYKQMLIDEINKI